jgi:hypothetical protein
MIFGVDTFGSILSTVNYEGFLRGENAIDWVEKCKSGSGWTTLEVETPQMTMCNDPVPLLISDTYEDVYPVEFLVSPLTTGTLTAVFKPVVNYQISVGDEEIHSPSSYTLSITINTIIQVPLNGGDESISSPAGGTLSMTSNVITQESLSAGIESVSSVTFGSLGIVIN